LGTWHKDTFGEVYQVSWLFGARYVFWL